jgi:hypothetical protein
MYKGEYKEGVIRKELLHEFYKTVKKEVGKDDTNDGQAGE